MITYYKKEAYSDFVREIQRNSSNLVTNPEDRDAAQQLNMSLLEHAHLYIQALTYSRDQRLRQDDFLAFQFWLDAGDMLQILQRYRD
jgi:uncharacterized Zn finger protein